jgi:exodeoxyribonuclease VII small subunit
MAKEISLEKLLSEEDAAKVIGTLSFEQGLKLLEQLNSNVESGTLPLERAMQSYELGMIMVTHLRKLLSGAEQKLKVLQKTSAGTVHVEEEDPLR